MGFPNDAPRVIERRSLVLLNAVCIMHQCVKVGASKPNSTTLSEDLINRIPISVGRRVAK